MNDMMTIENLSQAKEECSHLLDKFNALREEVNRQEEALKAYNSGLKSGIAFSTTLKGMIDGGMPEELAKEILVKCALQGALRGALEG